VTPAAICEDLCRISAHVVCFGVCLLYLLFLLFFVFFFFQAEDGIRDIGVTGVQTCALPIFHHCMRLIGCAQRALDLACERVEQRIAFGQPLSKQQSVRESIAQMHCDIEQARLLTLKAADKMDRYGNKVARDIIAAIKIVAPNMACKVIDQSIQMHGAAGTSQDFILSATYAYARTIKLADGPDQVHMMQLGRNLIKDHVGAKGA